MQENIIIVAVIGGISVMLILFVLSVADVFVVEPPPPAWEKPDDVVPNYENNTAIVTLRQGQKSGPVIVDYIRPTGEVMIERITPHAVGFSLVPVVMYEGETTSSCNARITLLDTSSNSATFEIVLTGGPCPICWHVFVRGY